MSGYNKKPRKSRSTGSSGSSRSGSGRTGGIVNPSSISSSVRGGTPTQLPSGSGGPLGLGFGGVSPLPSTTVKDSQITDWLGRQVGDLSAALNTNGNFADFLNALVSSGRLPEELQALIMQAATQYGMTQDQRLYDQSLTKDQREYDWNLLQDSRIYNNPLNELARLMGAGISRDAAIQMLSGSSGGSGVGSGGSPVVSPVPATGAASPFGGISNSRASNVINGIQLVANLFQQGVSMANAISQTRMLQNQAYMSDQQVSAFKGVNEITDAFNRAVYDGTLTLEDVQGLRTADDYYKWITDHADTNLVKPLVQSGAIANTFGSTVGRSMMNDHLEQTRLGRDSSRLFDSYVKSQELSQELQEIGVGQARRDYYVSLSTTLTDILSKDAGLALLYQQYMNGEKIIEINGKRVDLAEYEVRHAKRQDTVEGANFDAFTAALDSTTVVNLDGRQTTMSGKDILSYNAFTKLIRMYQNDAAMSGRHGVEVPTKDGGTTVMSARERYEKLLNENIMVAITGAFLQDAINNNRLSGYSGDLGPIYRFADMWNITGLGNLVKEVTPDVAMPIVFGK